ncbi:unnamed protein product [Diabrotica balteata]|uniref:RRM domain-containing protein n=1 Tax=Diabrotica balteata TaxID=107213 RepID=A0A9N9TGG8_DIABA|nr:unnamed protein product [Diabrotica balteata]
MSGRSLVLIFDSSQHRMVCSKGDFSSIYDVTPYKAQILATMKYVSPPGRGTEIFISGLRRDILIQEILEMMLPIGDIYQIRILQEFSGYCRGMGFVKFFDVTAARKATILLNKSKSQPIGIFDRKKCFPNTSPLPIPFTSTPPQQSVQITSVSPPELDQSNQVTSTTAN